MITLGEMTLRLGLAMLLGGLIGFQRGKHHHPAGLRTHILVTLAATLFTLVSTQLLYYSPVTRGEGHTVAFDPSRIASYVVAGMGFLGAGTIRHGRGRTHGLTTSASLWLVTAVGLALGVGMYAVSIITMTATLFILESLHRFEHVLIKGMIDRRVHLVCERSASAGELMKLIQATRWKSSAWTYGSDRQQEWISLGFKLRLADQEIPEAIASLEALPGVKRVELRHAEQENDQT